jgi:hypothetical protein
MEINVSAGKRSWICRLSVVTRGAGNGNWERGWLM